MAETLKRIQQEKERLVTIFKEKEAEIGKAIKTCNDSNKQIVKTSNDNADTCQKTIESFKQDKTKCYGRIKELETSNNEKTNVVHKMEIDLLQYKQETVTLKQTISSKMTQLNMY